MVVKLLCELYCGIYNHVCMLTASVEREQYCTPGGLHEWRLTTLCKNDHFYETKLQYVMVDGWIVHSDHYREIYQLELQLAVE